jgi:hypothetical protein
MLDTQERQRLDAWITRSDDCDEPMRQHCTQCGAFLPVQPDRWETHCDTDQCGGHKIVVEFTYTERDAAILDIIGWDKLGQTSYADYPSECGMTETHEPHAYVVFEWVHSYWDCRKCGNENKVVEA